jgi:hypothetical protein
MVEDQLRFIFPQPSKNPFSDVLRVPYHGVGRDIPFPTMVTFSRPNGLNDKTVSQIMADVAAAYGNPTQIARNNTSLTLLVPATVTLNHLMQTFASWNGLEVSIPKQPPVNL